MPSSSVSQVLARVRRMTLLRQGETELPLRLTHQESLAVANVEPSGFELARSGRRFMLGNNAAITGIQNVSALVTTAAQWVIWNADATKTLFFEELGVYNTSGTPGAGGSLLAALFSTPSQAAIAATAGTSVSSMSNGGAASKAIVKSAVTITVPAAPNWYVIANSPSPNVGAFPGGVFLENRSIQGRLAVPPGQGLALAVVGLAGTTPLFAPFASWCEIETDME